jgi:DNA-binding PadR family transcriptional regulator
MAPTPDESMTPAELTVLGLVIERPRHGYDLEQVIQQRGIRQWTDIGFSSIYYLLTKLEQRGMLHVPEAPAPAKGRRVFHATDRGRDAAARNALALIAELRPAQHPVLVGLANLPLLDEQVYDQALHRRLTQLEARIAAVAAAQQAQAPLPRPASEVFSFALSQLEAERRWLVARVGGSDDDQD